MQFSSRLDVWQHNLTIIQDAPPIAIHIKYKYKLHTNSKYKYNCTTKIRKRDSSIQFGDKTWRPSQRHPPNFLIFAPLLSTLIIWWKLGKRYSFIWLHQLERRCCFCWFPWQNIRIQYHLIFCRGFSCQKSGEAVFVLFINFHSYHPMQSDNRFWKGKHYRKHVKVLSI